MCVCVSCSLSLYSGYFCCCCRIEAFSECERTTRRSAESPRARAISKYIKYQLCDEQKRSAHADISETLTRKDNNVGISSEAVAVFACDRQNERAGKY